MFWIFFSERWQSTPFQIFFFKTLSLHNYPSICPPKSFVNSYWLATRHYLPLYLDVSGRCSAFGTRYWGSSTTGLAIHFPAKHDRRKRKSTSNILKMLGTYYVYKVCFCIKLINDFRMLDTYVYEVRLCTNQ